jgi:hypothetical protein
MSFDYATSGLPENNKWKIAAEICNQWLHQNMGMFGPERIANFMHNQPVAAAKRVMDNCDGWSEESMTLLLLGPAKGVLIASAEKEQVSRQIFGDRAVELLKSLMDTTNAVDPAMTRDVNRINIAEAISAMNDQMIGRHLFKNKGSRFVHHDTRKNMLKGFEETHAAVKGQDPKLDAIFEDAVKQSKMALDTIDQELAANKQQAPKPPKPKM